MAADLATLVGFDEADTAQLRALTASVTGDQDAIINASIDVSCHFPTSRK